MNVTGRGGPMMSQGEGAHVCHYPGLPVCSFTLSLPITKIPYYKTPNKTQGYNHKTLLFFKSTERNADELHMINAVSVLWSNRAEY